MPLLHKQAWDTIFLFHFYYFTAFHCNESHISTALYIKQVKLRRANTTLAPSQISCKSRHLSHILMCVKASCHHSAAHLSLQYLQIAPGKVCVFFLCARVTRKLPHPHFSALQLSPDAILPNCLTKWSESGSFLISCGHAVLNLARRPWPGPSWAEQQNQTDKHAHMIISHVSVSIAGKVPAISLLSQDEGGDETL